MSVLDELPAIGLLSLATATGGGSLGQTGQGGLPLVLGLLAAVLSYGIALWGGALLSRLAPPEEDVNRTLSVLSDVFLPLYFIGVGMRIQANTLLQPEAWALASVLVVLGIVSKLAFGLGISAHDRDAGVDRWLVVFGLIPRGLPGLVFATTALGAGLINATQFSALVIMVTVTTLLGLLLLEQRLAGLTRAKGVLLPVVGPGD